ncbi:Os05g0524575 [Oryza sativa Japonica Group]|uniref:Os05g0524575 protein n=1 Tax=Oryza sativa subsp. japonica TaxID=39947 RepID=A0A0P0WPS4_ORYSJ|nr:hypothetical protein EE612_030715 [Oryza sativa]BAS94976.1 Os05g0524575 [Oryza sativa Japonica Group]
MDDADGLWITQDSWLPCYQLQQDNTKAIDITLSRWLHYNILWIHISRCANKFVRRYMGAVLRIENLGQTKISNLGL